MVTGPTITGINTVTEDTVITSILIIIVPAAAILPAAVIGAFIAVITLGINQTGAPVH
jgi:hypothetical protein